MVFGVTRFQYAVEWDHGSGCGKDMVGHVTKAAIQPIGHVTTTLYGRPAEQHA